MTREKERLEQDAKRQANWKRWGPYLSERQWATVREDYSPKGTVWDYFPHEHARSRAYRWGEDGLLGIADRECRLCFALALWNGKDPFLKERLFGLAATQGNHGEDVKECYFYLDSTPTHSYMKALYKYPQAEFPYARLVEENHNRTRQDPEFELADTGIFEGSRYFDILAEYAKADPDDILVRITVANRGPEPAPLWLLPTLWYRNTWIWGCKHDGCWVRPTLKATSDSAMQGDHADFGRHYFLAGPGPDSKPPQLLFTGNETNTRKLYRDRQLDPLRQRRLSRVCDQWPSGCSQSQTLRHQSLRPLSVHSPTRRRDDPPVPACGSRPGPKQQSGRRVRPRLRRPHQGSR